MKYVLLILCAFAFTGCARAVSPWVWAAAVKKCEGRGGVHHIDTLLVPSVECMDGANAILSRPEGK